jgi:N-acetylneuraminate synthase
MWNRILNEEINNLSDRMTRKTQILVGNQKVGAGEPVYIVAEIGINHNGDLNTALRLIDASIKAGCDAVKFQKRSPNICVPEKQRDVIRETPWGPMAYLDYRHKVEFGEKDYKEIDYYCQENGITWFASCWDKASVDFMKQFKPVCYKIASASLTDNGLLRHIQSQGKPIILSTGMSTMDQIRVAVEILSLEKLLIAHSTSSYTCAPEELNLRMISTLQGEFDCPVGYSGHEDNLLPSCIAVALGACFVERHITLDRSMWGSDQSASLEPNEFKRLVSYIREVEVALGDGEKKVYDTERPVMAKLRKGLVRKIVQISCREQKSGQVLL